MWENSYVKIGWLVEIFTSDIIVKNAYVKRYRAGPRHLNRLLLGINRVIVLLKS